jgi:hypothetical protein
MIKRHTKLIPKLVKEVQKSVVKVQKKVNKFQTMQKRHKTTLKFTSKNIQTKTMKNSIKFKQFKFNHQSICPKYLTQKYTSQRNKNRSN